MIVSQNQGYLLGSSYNKDYTVFEFILWLPIWASYHVDFQGSRCGSLRTRARPRDHGGLGKKNAEGLGSM